MARSDIFQQAQCSRTRAQNKRNYKAPNCHETRKVSPFPKNLQDKRNYPLSGSDFFYRPFPNTPLVERISDYPFYNCFSDAVNGLERKVEVVRWGDYYLKSRYNKSLTIKDFTDTYTLKYERLPGYEHLTQKEYSKLMHQKLEERRAAIVNKLKSEGRTFLGKEALLKVIPGTPAKNPKTSNSQSHRPRVLSLCPNKRADLKAWYFDLYFKYNAVSKLYRAGDHTVQFPLGMYPPWLPCNFSP